MTHRQFIAWSVWLTESYNQPSRADWYAMAIVCEIRRILNKNPNSIQPTPLEFKTGVKKPKPKISKEERQRYATAMAKAKWGAFLGQYTKKPDERN